MIIGIPSMGDKKLKESVGEHFGRVPTYTIIDTGKDEVRVVPNSSEHMGGTGYPAEILSNEGVEVMVCSGIGRRAITMFAERGIKVYAGASGTIGETLEKFNNGDLRECSEQDACTQHAFGDHGEGHHHHHD